jgi:hypothetical protein
VTGKAWLNRSVKVECRSKSSPIWQSRMEPPAPIRPQRNRKGEARSRADAVHQGPKIDVANR